MRSLTDEVLESLQKTRVGRRETYNSQMTFEPVLQPRRVTMCPRIDSYKRAR